MASEQEYAQWLAAVGISTKISLSLPSRTATDLLPRRDMNTNINVVLYRYYIIIDMYYKHCLTA